MEEQLKQLIEQSNSIVITSHIGPDGDSVSSCLFLKMILEKNYPDKQIHISMEEDAPSLAFLEGYSDIKFGNLGAALSEAKPNLLILLDANTIKRISRNPDLVSQALNAHQTKLAIIDHHEADGRDQSDIYINQGNPAVAQDIYEIFIEKLKLSKPAGYAPVAMVGIYTDTGGFIHQNQNFKNTYRIIGQLVEDGANIELISNKLNRVSQPALAILDNLLANTSEFKGATYSFVDDQIQPDSKDVLREAVDLYKEAFLRNIGDRTWGFVVYPDVLATNHTYSVSFRALADSMDVSKIAGELGGGGHKPAAGAKVEVNSVSEAVARVKAAIEKSATS